MFSWRRESSFSSSSSSSLPSTTYFLHPLSFCFWISLSTEVSLPRCLAYTRFSVVLFLMFLSLSLGGRWYRRSTPREETPNVREKSVSSFFLFLLSFLSPCLKDVSVCLSDSEGRGRCREKKKKKTYLFSPVSMDVRKRIRRQTDRQIDRSTIERGISPCAGTTTWSSVCTGFRFFFTRSCMQNLCCMRKQTRREESLMGGGWEQKRLRFFRFIVPLDIRVHVRRERRRQLWGEEKYT